MLFINNSKEINVVHRTRMAIAKITGCLVVLGATEALVGVAHLTAQIQVSFPVKESLWLKIVKQFAIHVIKFDQKWYNCSNQAHFEKHVYLLMC